MSRGLESAALVLQLGSLGYCFRKQVVHSRAAQRPFVYREKTLCAPSKTTSLLLEQVPYLPCLKSEREYPFVRDTGIFSVL